MANFGHVRRVTRSVGGKEYTFRSKLEYRWAVWCELRKSSGDIDDWWFEDAETLLELEMAYFHNKKLYLPDFTIQVSTDNYEFEECKGYFSAKDYTKIKTAAQQYDNPFTLIFAKRPYGVQYRRAERLKPHLKRIIYDAEKTIFKPISGLFDL